jgi:hypothetical protein
LTPTSVLHLYQYYSLPAPRSRSLGTGTYGSETGSAIAT